MWGGPLNILTSSAPVWWVLGPGPRLPKSRPGATSLLSNTDFNCPGTPNRLHARSHRAHQHGASSLSFRPPRPGAQVTCEPIQKRTDKWTAEICLKQNKRKANDNNDDGKNHMVILIIIIVISTSVTVIIVANAKYDQAGVAYLILVLIAAITATTRVITVQMLLNLVNNSNNN